MAAITDFANNAAAVAAGYARVQYAYGSGWVSRYEKPITGEPGNSSGQLLVAEGHSIVSQAAADTTALAALNAQRRHRYGGAPGRSSADGDSVGQHGGTHVADQT
jgi:hypothetical protein